eukprot:272379-Chlamydomonas_euryale.AAC.2
MCTASKTLHLPLDTHCAPQTCAPVAVPPWVHSPHQRRRQHRRRHSLSAAVARPPVRQTLPLCAAPLCAQAAGTRNHSDRKLGSQVRRLPGSLTARKAGCQAGSQAARRVAGRRAGGQVDKPTSNSRLVDREAGSGPPC